MCAAGAAAGAAPASRGARAACAAAAPSDALARGAEAAAEGAAADYAALRRVALLLVQTGGMNAADVERARGERDAARAEVRRSAAVPSQLTGALLPAPVKSPCTLLGLWPCLAGSSQVS